MSKLIISEAAQYGIKGAVPVPYEEPTEEYKKLVAEAKRTNKIR